MPFTRKHKKKLKKKKYYKKSRRYNKTNKRRRKTKRRRRKKKTRKRRRKKQRGGYSTYKCNSPSNMGEIYTGIKLNTDPFFPDPKNSNTNMRGNQKGGHSNGSSSPTSGMGGSFLNSIGLGDVLLNYYKGSNAISNQPIRYNGGKPLMKADPMYQPNLKSPIAYSKTANIPSFYNTASRTAVANTIV